MPLENDLIQIILQKEKPATLCWSFFILEQRTFWKIRLEVVKGVEPLNAFREEACYPLAYTTSGRRYELNLVSLQSSYLSVFSDDSSGIFHANKSCYFEGFFHLS